MAKYRVAFDHKEIRSIEPAHEPNHTGDAILEDNIGETIFAIIDAADDKEAREKAQRLQTELQTRQTKRDLTGGSEEQA